MKIRNLMLIPLTMSLFACSHKIVYNEQGQKKKYVSEDIDLTFLSPPAADEIKFPTKPGIELAPAFLAMLPTLVDVGLKLTTNALENRAKKFSAEYTKQKSNLCAGKGNVPHLSLKRTVVLEGQSAAINALTVSFKAKKVDKLNGYVYYIDEIERGYSAAKVNNKNLHLDYTFEMKIIYLIDGEKKAQELGPITVTSIPFGKSNLSAGYKHRTDIIPLPEGAVLTEVSLNVIETNPVKVKSEKILALWNDQKDNVKTIVNNFLPKEKEDEDENEMGSTESTGNEEATKKKKENN